MNEKIINYVENRFKAIDRVEEIIKLRELEEIKREEIEKELIRKVEEIKNAITFK